MNQASIHKYLALENKKTKANDVESLFEQRLATNFTLIKDLFFSLYPEDQHKKSFKRLLTTLPELF